MLFTIPVIRRELQVTGRDPALYRHRTLVAAIALVAAVLLVRFSSAVPTLVGQGMFKIFAWGGFGLCLLEGARAAADAISGEKREGTLGLLFLTDLRPRDVVLGKFTFVGIRSLVLVVPILPAFALPLLFGGVTIGESSRVMLTLLITLLFGLSAGLLASSLSISSTGAWGRTALLLLLITIQPVVALIAGHAWMRLPAHWTAGPLGMMLASSAAHFAANPATFALATLFSAAVSVGMVVAATYFTRQRVSLAPMLSTTIWWQRWLQPRRGYLPPWGEGSDQSPSVWLAQRTLPGQRVLWALLYVGLAGCFVCGLFRIAALAIALQILFGALLKLWIAAVAPQSLHELRKSGALELILCTPLQPAAIVKGQVDLLYEYVIGPALVIAVGFAMSFQAANLIMRRTDTSQLAMMVPAGIIWLVYLFLDLHALGYLGVWHGLSSRRIESAVGKTAWYGLILPWLVFVVPVLGWVTLLFWPVLVILWATKRLKERFHESLIDV